MLMLTAAGRLGKDATIRHTQGGDKVLSFSIAVSVYKDKTQWIDCAIWGDRGEKLAKFLTKGTQVAVVGEPSTRTYESGGETRVALDCRVDKVTLMGGGQKSDEPTDRDHKRGGGPTRGHHPADDLDDTIPFTMDR